MSEDEGKWLTIDSGAAYRVLGGPAHARRALSLWLLWLGGGRDGRWAPVKTFQVIPFEWYLSGR